jgi:ABC-type branched-subunit amino acid transport system ATPase component/branched-subunit amino acid ABC-type transport system permease component
MTILQFTILGLGFGAIYGLAAMGMVLIYRGSGVVNLAHGAVGMVGTYTFWILHDNHNQPFFVSVIPALAVCCALGFLIQRLVMHPLRNSSAISRLLATLGVLAALQGAVAIKYPDETEVVRSSLPTSPVKWGSLVVGEDRLIILGIGLALAAAFGLFYRRTRFGLATSAVAENPRVASHLGFSPNYIASINWALGSMLAGIAGILISPITGLQTTSLTLLVVPALAAALLGSMVSFPLAIAGGLMIGVGESLVTRYVSTPGWSAAVPLALVLIVLTLRGTNMPGRGEAALRLPRIGTGHINWYALVAGLASGIVLLQTIPINWVDGANVTIVSAFVLLSVVVVTGYAGQLSLAQVALAGLGSLVASRLIADAHTPFLVGILGGMLAAIPIGIVIGLPAVRSRGSNLAIVTLTMSVAVEALIFGRSSWTGGDLGVPIGFPKLFGLSIDDITYPRRYTIFTLVVFVLCGVAVANLRRGRTGRRLIAVRANERAAASLGVSVAGAKLYAFALSGVLASLGGILLSFRQPSVVFSNFNSFDSTNYVADSVIGGVGYSGGPLVGGVLQVGGLGTNIGNELGSGVQKYLPLIGGIILILVLIKDPDGAVASMGQNLRSIRKLFRHNQDADSPEPSVSVNVRAGLAGTGVLAGSEVRRVPAKLSLKNVSVRFGTTYVVRDVTLDVNPGEVVGLIGPNGSGKTTLMDAMTGFVKLAHGDVEFDSQTITNWDARRRGAAGIARSFQSLELFEDMTVLENLLVASERNSPLRGISDLVHPGTPRLTPAAIAAIDQFDLWRELQNRPTEMSYGRRRLLAIARAIAAQPAVLLLDESASGLNPEERAELSDLIRSIAKDTGTGVLLIEHDVEMVLRTSDRVVALKFGEIVAQGDPDDIRRHPEVVRSYLGDEETVADPEAETAIEVNTL